MKLFVEAFVTLIVITDPPGMMPIFLALTGSFSARERNRAAWQAVAEDGSVREAHAPVTSSDGNVTLAIDALARPLRCHRQRRHWLRAGGFHRRSRRQGARRHVGDAGECGLGGLERKSRWEDCKATQQALLFLRE